MIVMHITLYLLQITRFSFGLEGVTPISSSLESNLNSYGKKEKKKSRYITYKKV